MKKDRIKFLILLCGILLLGLSYVFYNYQEIDVEDKNAFVFKLKAKKINKRLDEEVDKIRTDVNFLIEELTQQNTSPLKLFKQSYESDVPFYVLKNGTLVYWSDQKVAFNTNSFEGDFLWKVVTGKFGVYLLHKEKTTSGSSNFEIIHALPLFIHYQIQNNYLKSHFNPDIFQNNEVEIHTKPKQGLYNLLIDDKVFVVSFSFLPQSKLVGRVNDFWIISVSLGFFLLVLYVSIHARELYQKHKFVSSQLVLTGGLILIRALMLQVEFPSKFVDSQIFDAKYFAYSSLFPSIGDFVFNLLVVLMVVFLLYSTILHSDFYKNFSKISTNKRIFITPFLIIISFGSAVLFYVALQILYDNSQWEYDITQKIDFNFFEFFYLMMVLCLIFIFFFLNRLLLKLIFKLNNQFSKQVLWLFLCSLFLSILIIELFFKISVLVIILQATYLFVVYFHQLFVQFQRFRYGIYVYLILTSITCAGIGAIVIFKKSQQNEFLNKERFAEQLVFHRDYQGEFLLGELSEEIEEDAFH